MLKFIDTACSIMTLLLKDIPAFEVTWIECLGNLARYRIAFEEDMSLRETWNYVARS
jgi:hypothetical protein